MSLDRYLAFAKGDTPFSLAHTSELGAWQEPVFALMTILGGNAPSYEGPSEPLPQALAVLTKCRACFVLGGELEANAASILIAPAADGTCQMVLDVSHAWLRASRRQAIGATSVWERVKSSKIPDVIVDAAMLRSIETLYPPKENATAETRFATHKARAEGLVDRELLASILLARARRLESRAYLSRAILLQAIDAYPETWKDWVETELLLSGYSDFVATATTSKTIVAMYESQKDGSTPELLETGHRYAEELYQLSLFLGVDTSLMEGGPPKTPAFGIRDAYKDQPLWDLIVHPSGDTTRKFPSARQNEAKLEADDHKARRPAFGLSFLALAGKDGMSTIKWFRQTFGYHYVAGSHANLLRVTIHRMRKLLPKCAAIHREGETLRLETKRGLILPDPAASLPLEAMVLQHLASGTRTAKDVARALAVPLRTIQGALKKLLEAGICSAQRLGARREYIVEDTSFFAPTIKRLRGE